MGFAFSQTQNLSQRADTRSGIIPVKWGFSSDVDNLDIGSQVVGTVRTSALMNIEATGEKSCFGNFTNSLVSSGNNETSNLTTQSEANWRTLEINPNAKEICLYIITRSGNGGSVNQFQGLNCTQAGNGRGDCCDSTVTTGNCACDCVCDGQGCSGTDTCSSDNCVTFYDCCNGGGASGGDAGYYKVSIDVENLPQEALWVYLAQFNGNSAGNGNSDCNDTIKVEIYNSTLPFGQGGSPNMSGGLYADFKVYPGQTGDDINTGVRGQCGQGANPECTECDGGPCLPCPAAPSPGDDSSYDTPYINPSVASSITVTVTEVTADAFWGAAGNNGWLQQEFGWGSGTPSIPGDFVSKNYGNTGGANCFPDITVTPNPAGSPPIAGACNCDGETFDTNGSTDVYRTSGQLIGFVVN